MPVVVPPSSVDRVRRAGVLAEHHDAGRGVAARIASAARTPSSVCVGGIRMSASTASGRYSSTAASRLSWSPTRPRPRGRRPSPAAAPALAQEVVVVGDHHPHGHRRPCSHPDALRSGSRSHCDQIRTETTDGVASGLGGHRGRRRLAVAARRCRGCSTASRPGRPRRRSSRTPSAGSPAPRPRTPGSAGMPVPAGISLPMMMFSLRPTRLSPRPSMAASVSTRVVSWNDAADSHDSVASDALVMPMISGRPSAGTLAGLDHRLFVSRNTFGRPARRAGSRCHPAPARRCGASSGARSARCACRGSTRPGRGRPSGPLRRGTAGSRGRP